MEVKGSSSRNATKKRNEPVDNDRIYSPQNRLRKEKRRMNKSEALKQELKKIGIHTENDLKEAIKKTSTNISLMTASKATEHTKERKVG